MARRKKRYKRKYYILVGKKRKTKLKTIGFSKKSVSRRIGIPIKFIKVRR